MGLFVRHQTVEYRQHALAVLINAIQIRAECALKILRLDPFVDDDSRHVNILPKGIHGMPAQEQAIEESSLALRGQRVEIVSRTHETRRKDILTMDWAKDQVSCPEMKMNPSLIEKPSL